MITFFLTVCGGKDGCIWDQGSGFWTPDGHISLSHNSIESATNASDILFKYLIKENDWVEIRIEKMIEKIGE